MAAALAACGGGGGGDGPPTSTATPPPVVTPEPTPPTPTPPPVEPPVSTTEPVVTLPFEGIYSYSLSTTKATGGVTLIKPDGSFWSTSMWTDEAVWSTRVDGKANKITGNSIPLGKATGRYVIDGTYEKFKSLVFTLARPEVPVPDPSISPNFGGQGTSAYQAGWNTNIAITPLVKIENVRQENEGSSLIVRADGTFSGEDFQPSSQTPTLACKYDGLISDTGLAYKEVTFTWGVNCFTREGTPISAGVPMLAVLVPTKYVLRDVTKDAWILIAKNETGANRNGFSRLFNR